MTQKVGDAGNHDFKYYKIYTPFSSISRDFKPSQTWPAFLISGIPCRRYCDAKARSDAGYEQGLGNQRGSDDVDQRPHGKKTKKIVTASSPQLFIPALLCSQPTSQPRHARDPGVTMADPVPPWHDTRTFPGLDPHHSRWFRLATAVLGGRVRGLEMPGFVSPEGLLGPGF